MNDISNPNWSSKTILIVEDDKFNGLILINLMKKTEAKCVIAISGEEAVEMALKIVPDLILMDVKLPNMNGLEATQIIKKTHPAIPVIAQTAFVTDEDIKAAFDAGCNDFISKPIRNNILISTISKYFDK